MDDNHSPLRVGRNENSIWPENILNAEAKGQPVIPTAVT